MAILGIETSTAVCSVGLVDESGAILERSLIESHIHSEKLLALVHEVCGGSLRALQGVAVSIGPGSFTGLRIGLSSAKGLCYGLDIPLLAVPTFSALAHAALKSLASSCVVICIDAKQGDVYSGVFRKNGEEVEEEMPVRIVPWKEILNVAGEKAAFITDNVDKMKTLNPSFPCVNVHTFCHGAVVAQLGRDLLQKQCTADLAACEPVYLKDFVVTTQSRKAL